MASVFQVKNLKKSFGEKTVLKDISLQVKQGEVVAVIGPSGSGKTTFLRCATMLEEMDSGDLCFSGLCVTDSKTKAQARIKCGLVFQNFNLFPHFSVLQNITDAPIHVQKQDRKEAVETAMKLLKKMGLEDRADAYPCELSGGQQQRVSIARALAMNPEILFFDEPTSALDPELTNEILKVIRGLADEKMTMVIVTHEIDFAAAVADRIVFMADGYIVEEGPAKELVANPKNERTRAFLAGLDKSSIF